MLAFGPETEMPSYLKAWSSSVCKYNKYYKKDIHSTNSALYDSRVRGNSALTTLKTAQTTSLVHQYIFQKSTQQKKHFIAFDEAPYKTIIYPLTGSIFRTRQHQEERAHWGDGTKKEKVENIVWKWGASLRLWRNHTVMF